uniref:Cytochrome P450 4V2 n=1 Tax=Cacopsylla melanoneura TaxID=428564 RepID=A0A8D8YJY1_9HEMI
MLSCHQRRTVLQWLWKVENKIVLKSFISSLVFIRRYSPILALNKMFLFGLILIYSLSALCIVVLYVWKHRRYYYLGFKLPGQTMSSLAFLFDAKFLGTLETFPQNMRKYWDSQRYKYLSIFKFWYGWKLIVIFVDPDIIQKIFGKHLQKDDVIYRMAKTFTNGPSLFHENWIAKWKSHRKIISLASFTPSALKSYVNIFHEEANILADNLGLQAVNGQPVEANYMLGLSSFSMIVRTMAGVDLKIQQNFQRERFTFITMVEEYTRFLFMFPIIKPWLWIPAVFALFGYKKQEIYARKQTRELGDKIIAKVKAKVIQENANQDKNVIREGISAGKSDSNSENTFEDDPEISTDTALKKTFIEAIVRDQMDPTIPRQNVLNHDELVSELITIIFAGMDTTKVANNVILILLALHPKIQQEVYDEIQAVMGTDPSIAPTYDQLQELHLLTRVIKESLRLFPSGPIVGRQAAEEIQIDGYTIPKGAAIWVTIFCGPHRDPRYWSNPDRFDPDRFLPSETKGRNPNAYMPFSTGPRNCIGQKYAMLQIKTMISTILRRYRILPGEQCTRVEDVRWEFHITMKLLSGNDIRLEPRA